MNILNTHIYNLSFKLDSNTPKRYVDKWNKIKNDIEMGHVENIIRMVKNDCKLESNKNLPYLQRIEGGLGGDSNILNKQLRFNSYEDKNIISLSVLNSDSLNEIWTYEELDDILRSCIMVLSGIMQCDCVSGCIELYNEDMLKDDYFE